MNRSQLLEIAQKVYNNRGTMEDTQNKRLSQAVVAALRESNIPKPKGKGPRPPGKGRKLERINVPYANKKGTGRMSAKTGKRKSIARSSNSGKKRSDGAWASSH